MTRAVWRASRVRRRRRAETRSTMYVAWTLESDSSAYSTVGWETGSRPSSVPNKALVLHVASALIQL